MNLKSLYFKFRMRLLTALLIIIITFSLIYYYYIRLVYYKLHECQDKYWMSDLTDTLILGVNDRSLYKKINCDGTNISLWYCYWFFQFENQTVWMLCNLHNKFSTKMSFRIYSYDYDSKEKTFEYFPVDFKDIETNKNGNTVEVKLKDIYSQKINIIDGACSVKIKTKKNSIQLNIAINDFRTNVPSFVPPVFNILSKFVNTNAIQTYTPGEWHSDNPIIGKITDGMINGKQIRNGNYWFDNYISCNNGFITANSWFCILNDDWLIWLFYYGDDDEYNKKNPIRPCFIKNMKENKMIYCGIINCSSAPNLLNTVEITYESKKKMGDDNFDDYKLTLISEEINIFITSKKNTCHKVNEFDFYDSGDVKNESFSNDWDKEYNSVLNNMTYKEYVIEVDVNLVYNNNTETFTAKQVMDCFIRKDRNIPRTIDYK